MRIFLLLLLLGMSVCTKSDIVSYDLVVADPSTSYRKGHYRNVVEIFEKSPQKANTIELQYIWGSSYRELREYQKAFEVFSQIDAQNLINSEEYEYLFPFFIRKYLQILIELKDPNILTPEEGVELMDWVKLVPEDSPIRSYLDHEIFSVLWATDNYLGMLLLDKNLSLQGKAWVELAKSRLGQPYDIHIIISAQKTFNQNKAYSHLLNTLDPQDFRTRSSLNNLVEMNLRIPEYRDKALVFAKRYRTLFRDTEYYTSILARKTQLDGNRSEAGSILYNYLQQNPKASLDMYKESYEFLVKYKQFDFADEIATQAQQYYQKQFYREVKSGLEFHKDPSYVFQWYQKNYRNIPIDHHLQAIRALIRTDMGTAEKALDLGIEPNKEYPEYVLMHGLVKEHLGKKEEAYQDYLHLIFQDAFGYAGIVAKHKEKSMREEFRDRFEVVLEDLLPKMSRFPLKDRLMLMKSFLVDEELAQYVDKIQLQKDQKAFDKIIYADIAKVKKISILEEYPQALSNLAPETQDYVENAVADAMKKDKNWHNTARYYYRYKDIFLNSDIEGYLTFRMYFYLRDFYGPTYMANYPKEMMEIVFPKPEFELIKEWSDHDEDLAYWMLSSFMAESHFRKRVYSLVGAVGFAQVMPYTAKDIKRWLKKPELSNYDFYDNMRMGVYYHKRMYELMDDNIILSLAAYNAGPGAVNRWKKQYPYLKDDYLFIEAIDYQETRNYVKTIIYNHGMYRLLNDNDLY